ncbi:ATP synthase subunit b 1 [Beijerinckia indica]|uniref:ATP synthase subunit b 1 n=1 Tax=Beijerinckia indica subsp. indica (strain ATCC 9039 / DSM 1715 / NCIMB 8712) TaxID=395963 RepID=ATPF1_BEII9|nr:ATP synthase subunit b 1 [Beijerinckia indica]B2IGK8.1 RecName: Full=ATP synthase subunit b 1; AltName: Full=ATP synthase F(0) sector subunit b 1; AltName: Full=ATPase subunit I 1; AltName: Full=F-type ATPase subunit b 1; Short=F-ATPase subunit b 1 [Beijerinckia indica subsp. indica ATCC 9039]ACB94390.1 H+transporting two-sector ATPase B/B' subunit [Beijerinckia indica subsp. indica ATCC 9039]
MEFNEEFYVALGFVIFVAILLYYGVHNKLNAALDKRADRIREDLAHAVRLREEAAALLASFEKRKAEAEAEAEALVAQARTEAEMIAKEAHERLAEFVQRRTQQAENKIANAEAQAMAEVKAIAADAATKAAEILLTDAAKGAYGQKLIDQGIDGLKAAAH